MRTLQARKGESVYNSAGFFAGNFSRNVARMRIMALDLGEARTGIAVSDPDETVASPVCVLPTAEILANAATWRRTLEDWEPELLLFGLPLTMQGERGPQAELLSQRAQDIAHRAGLPLQFVDERLTSVTAKRILREKGLSEKDMRGKVDMIAASIFLETWLDARKTNTAEEGTQICPKRTQ